MVGSQTASSFSRRSASRRRGRKRPTREDIESRLFLDGPVSRPPTLSQFPTSATRGFSKMTLPFLRCAAYPMSFPAASLPFTRLAVASSYSTTSPTRPPPTPTSASNAGTWQANQELAKSGSAAGLKPRTRPTGLRSPAEVRASQQAQELREAAISNSGWRKSQEEGEEEEWVHFQRFGNAAREYGANGYEPRALLRRRVVYSRRGSPPNGLVWAFIISTTTCL